MSADAVINLQKQRDSRDLVLKGTAAVQDKRFDEARRTFERALDVDRDCVEAYFALARLRFPGEFYLDLLARIHRLLQPKTYVEIGVGNGASLSRVLPSTQCVGVDPGPTLPQPVPANVKLIRLKSEELFCKENVRELLGLSSIDLGFVDGMHLFESVLSDFGYLERHASPDGTILIHDCLPFDALTSARARTTRFWTGDVWRIVPTLKRFRPDLDITVIECAPSGLAIVRHLDPNSRVLESERPAMLSFGNDCPIQAPLAGYGIRILPSEWPRVARVFENRA